MQPLFASKKISFTYNAKHVEQCIKHMSKITTNNTHRHDDIADTLSDAIRIFHRKPCILIGQEDRQKILMNMNQSLQRKIKARTAAYGGYR